MQPVCKHQRRQWIKKTKIWKQRVKKKKVFFSIELFSSLHSPFTWAGKQISTLSWKHCIINPISPRYFLCLLHFHPVCESVPGLCSECLITALKKKKRGHRRRREGNGGGRFRRWMPFQCLICKERPCTHRWSMERWLERWMENVCMCKERERNELKKNRLI